MTSLIPTVSVAGLQVPAPLVPRIIAAFRGEYPALTEGLGDDASVRAVLKHWVTATLAAYESREAEAPADGAVAATREEYRRLAQEAFDQAVSDAGTIVEAPPPPAPAP